jgi:hypothetical protein
MNKSAIVGLVYGALTLGACTHANIDVVKPGDSRISCMDIAAELAEIRGVLRDIDDKTGMSGRNVAMGIFFWPGIVVNQMNAGDAREAANARLAILSGLKTEKDCK